MEARGSVSSVSTKQSRTISGNFVVVNPIRACLPWASSPFCNLPLLADVPEHMDGHERVDPELELGSVPTQNQAGPPSHLIMQLLLMVFP